MRALITGCSSGNGRALAVELTRRRYHVIASARRVETLAHLDVADRIPLDVADGGSIERALARAGRVDVLVNNAGFGIRGPVERMPVARARELFETIYFGPLALIQGILPGMRERGWGVVVNVASGMAGLVVRPFNSFYAAPKIALEAMSEGLAYEVEPFGLRVLIIQPGTIVTNFRSSMLRLGQDGVYAERAAGVERWRARFQRSEAKTTAEELARRVADAIEADDPPLRIPVGADAVESLARRRRQTDEEFHDAVLKEFIPADQA